MPFKYKSIVLL